ncbi:MAG: hypothetical protein M0O96_02550 [Desulforhopalus sp.]|nr:hypothetical protein [Desulforhopalus sp.]
MTKIIKGNLEYEGNTRFFKVLWRYRGKKSFAGRKQYFSLILYISPDKSPPEQTAESRTHTIGEDVENIWRTTRNKRLMELIGNPIGKTKKYRKTNGFEGEVSAPVRLESKENGTRKQAVDSTMGNLIHTGKRWQMQLIAGSVG